MKFLIVATVMVAVVTAQGTKGGKQAAASQPRPSYGTKSGEESRESALPAFVEPPPAPNPEPDDAASEPGMPYSFSYTAEATDGMSARQESSDGSTVRGSYMLNGPDGIQRVVHYIADKDGYRATIQTNEPGTESMAPSGVLLESSQLPASEIALQYGPGEPDRQGSQSASQPLRQAPPPPARQQSQQLQSRRQEQPQDDIEEDEGDNFQPINERSLGQQNLPRSLPQRQQPLPPAPLRRQEDQRQQQNQFFNRQAPPPPAPLRRQEERQQWQPSQNPPQHGNFGFRQEIRHEAQPSGRSDAVKGGPPPGRKAPQVQAPVAKRPPPPQQQAKAPVRQQPVQQQQKAPALRASLPPSPPIPQPFRPARQQAPKPIQIQPLQAPLPIRIQQQFRQPQPLPIRQVFTPALRAAPQRDGKTNNGKTSGAKSPQRFYQPTTTTTEQPQLYEEQQQQQEEVQQEEQPVQQEEQQPVQQEEVQQEQQQSQEEEPEPQQQEEQQQQQLLDEPQNFRSLFRRRA